MKWLRHRLFLMKQRRYCRWLKGHLMSWFGPNIHGMTAEELLEIMPGRNKYWEIPNVFSNDWWLNIEQSWASVNAPKDKYGKMQNTWLADYRGDNGVLLREERQFYPTLKEALIDLLEYLRVNKLYDYRNLRLQRDG